MTYLFRHALGKWLHEEAATTTIAVSGSRERQLRSRGIHDKESRGELAAVMAEEGRTIMLTASERTRTTETRRLRADPTGGEPIHS